jgi:hypothetical protein
LGRGSSNWAGREKRTAARSETPMKRRRMDRNVLNFELSSAAFSTCAFAGVEAREGSFELTAEAVAAGSAMVQSVSRRGCSVQCAVSYDAGGIGAVAVVVAVAVAVAVAVVGRRYRLSSIPGRVAVRRSRLETCRPWTL